MKQITSYLISIILFAGADLSASKDSAVPKATTEKTHAALLDVVTPVHAVQKLIIGYLGNAWYLKSATNYDMANCSFDLNKTQNNFHETLVKKLAPTAICATSPATEYLAYSTGDQIVLVSLINNNIIKQFSCPGPDHVTALVWLNETELLVGHPTELSLWQIFPTEPQIQPERIRSCKSRWVNNIWPLYKTEQHGIENRGCIVVMGNYWHKPERENISYLQIWENFAQNKYYNPIELDLPVQQVSHALSADGSHMALVTGTEIKLYENPAAILLAQTAAKNNKK